MGSQPVIFAGHFLLGLLCVMFASTSMAAGPAEPEQSAPRQMTAQITAPIESGTTATVTHTNVLRPYQARYHTTTMGLGITLKRSLTEQDGVYTLSNAGELIVAGISETAHFTLAEGSIRGIDFLYELTGLVKRCREVQFDAERSVIRSLKKKTWSEHPWQPDILDRLSQQEALRLALMNAETAPALLEFTVIDGTRIKTHQLEWVGDEKLATEVGELDTVHYRQIHEDPQKRASDIWLAKDFDYLMVRTRHIENDTPVDITLIDASIDGAAVAGRTW